MTTSITPTATAGAPASTSATGLVGADVDALDRLSREFTQAAQVCTEVKQACEVIVAVASMFGPFAASFIAYLKGTVIPWLAKIAEALQAMSRVLSAHSQAQKDASSNATSLPGYQSPTDLPQTNTQDYPTMAESVATTALAALFGPVGSTTAALAMIGAVSGSQGTTGASETGEKSADPEDPERVAPHSAEWSKNFGNVMNRETVKTFEEEELGVEKGSSMQPTATIAQTDGEAAVFSRKGENVDLSILQAKGSAAVFGGYNPKDGYQFGAGANASLDLVDLKLHDDVGLGSLGTLKLADESSVGATAQAQAIAAYNPSTQTATVTAGGDAFVGAKTTATVQEVTRYFTNTTELTGYAGAGAAADGGIVLSPGHIDIHGGFGAAVGLGGKVSDNVDINYQQIASDAYTGASTLANEAYTGASAVADGAAADLDAAGRAVSGYFYPVTPVQPAGH